MPLEGGLLPDRGRIELEVNGSTRQQGDLAQMIWSCSEIVSELSKQYRLFQGDLIYTGTPPAWGSSFQAIGYWHAFMACPSFAFASESGSNESQAIRVGTCRSRRVTGLADHRPNTSIRHSQCESSCRRRRVGPLIRAQRRKLQAQDRETPREFLKGESLPLGKRICWKSRRWMRPHVWTSGRVTCICGFALTQTVPAVKRCWRRGTDTRFMRLQRSYWPSGNLCSASRRNACSCSA